MTHLQEAFLRELESNPKFTVAEYAALYKKHSRLAIEHEGESAANIHQAKAMGNYYTVTVLSDFINSENKLARIIAFHESKKKS